MFATPALSLTPREWCFPIAGCVNYRGYFAEAEARAEAARLAANGDDVHIGGVPAYSTLGYFSDPMLSTFIRYPDTEIARLIFHELAHQVVYAKDDTVFNESYAVAVEEEGLRRWLAAQHDPDLDRQFALSERYREGFIALVATHAREARSALRERRRRRGQAGGQGRGVRRDARRLRARSSRPGAGTARTTTGSRRGPNNASLAAVSIYTQKVPQFRALLARRRRGSCRGSTPASRRSPRCRRRSANRRSRRPPACARLTPCPERARGAAPSGVAP